MRTADVNRRPRRDDGTGSGKTLAGASLARISGCTTVSEQLRRRREASRRMPCLSAHDRRRDPLDPDHASAVIKCEVRRRYGIFHGGPALVLNASEAAGAPHAILTADPDAVAVPVAHLSDVFAQLERVMGLVLHVTTGDDVA